MMMMKFTAMVPVARRHEDFDQIEQSILTPELSLRAF